MRGAYLQYSIKTKKGCSTKTKKENVNVEVKKMSVTVFCFWIFYWLTKLFSIWYENTFGYIQLFQSQRN